MPGPHHNPSPVRDYLAVVVITAVVMLVPLTPACSKRLEVVASPAHEVVMPEVWATDGAAPDAGPITRPMPAAPFEGQKKPPCTPRRQVAINGGCWVELAAKPLDDQCGDDGYAHGGRCYIPVKQAKRPPTSVAP